jgi:hypothetical protein
LKSIICSFTGLLLIVCCGQYLSAQTITGAWKGKIGNARTALKIVKKGDSLVGTSYYYTSKSNYRRYAIRGYFDSETNNVVWWDDVLLEDKLSGRLLAADKDALLAVADFNCPGEEKMMLDGESTERDDKEKTKGPLHLEKVSKTDFNDEWDFVIDNYLVGANHPRIIDSIAALSFNPPPIEEERETEIPASTIKPPTAAPATAPVVVNVPPVSKESTADPIEHKFTSRTKKLQTVIPITANKIELRFYDNALVDGDSIALFLNNRLIFKNIRLTDQAYSIVLHADELQDDNELVMVAENLGSIPPNTSLMVAIVGNKEYEARLFANEKSSALIRLIKQNVNKSDDR